MKHTTTGSFGLTVRFALESPAWAVVTCDECGTSFDLCGPLDLGDALTPHVETHLAADPTFDDPAFERHDS